MPELIYKVVKRRNPSTATVKFFPIKVHYTNIGNDALVARIKENTNIPTAVVSAAVSAIRDSIVNFLCNGHSVQLGNFMSLRPTISSSGADSMEAVSVGNIRAVRIRATYGTDLKHLQDPSYYTIKSVNEAAADAGGE